MFSTAEEKTGYQAGGVDKVVGAVAAGEEKQAEDEKLVADVKSGGAHVGRGEEDMGVIPFAPVCGEEFFFAVVVHLCPGRGVMMEGMTYSSCCSFTQRYMEVKSAGVKSVSIIIMA